VRDALNVAFTYRRRERLYKVGEVLRRLGRPRELSVNRVKIDRSFVNPDALRFAEGVEGFGQLLHLQDARCDQAQG
jgi:EAL domain-containing protein (putative c-di-GMP-specific phosphodiesterase class I)